MNKRIRKIADKANFKNKDEESIEYFAELLLHDIFVKLAEDTSLGPARSSMIAKLSRRYGLNDFADKIKTELGIES